MLSPVSSLPFPPLVRQKGHGIVQDDSSHILGIYLNAVMSNTGSDQRTSLSVCNELMEPYIWPQVPA